MNTLPPPELKDQGPGGDLFDPGPEPVVIRDTDVARAEVAADQLRNHLAELGLDSSSRATVIAHALLRETRMADAANQAVRIASHAVIGEQMAKGIIANGQPETWQRQIRYARERAGRTTSLAYAVRETVIANMVSRALERWVAEGRTS